MLRGHGDRGPPERAKMGAAHLKWMRYAASSWYWNWGPLGWNVRAAAPTAIRDRTRFAC